MSKAKEQMDTAKRRHKGEGTITRLDERRWRVLFELPPVNGKRTRKTAVVYSEREAVKKLNEFKAEQTKGTLVANSDIRFSEYAKRWLALKENNTKPTTYGSYVQTIDRYLAPTFGELKLQKIKTAHINDFIAKELKEGLSTATVARHRAILHGVFELAVSEGVVPLNICDNTDSIRIEHKDTRALSEEEANLLLVTAREDYEKNKGKGNKFWQLYHILLLAMSAGLRRGELLALKWSKVDLKNHTVRIDENMVEVKGGVQFGSPKSKKSKRTIALDEAVIEKLKELDDGKSDYVFHTRDGNHLTPSNVNRAFRKLVQDSGIAHVRFHDLRHTHATLLISKGVDVKTVSERLGHDDVRLTLQQYTHVISEADRKAAVLASNLLKVSDHEIPKENFEG